MRGDSKKMVNSKILNNSPIKVEYSATVYTIFGHDLAYVQGKTVINKLYRVETDFIPIPRDFYEIINFATLTTDMIFVNGIEFMTTL